ncbi:hypothetical protein LRS73_29650 [Methylobacterium currus]|uniref:hypothetical protein n=1 Tax=Methylobacterium currus TaxID=2051553 RepID=UPI000F4D347A|nr:hypothetical protein [Methylobacterium currus]UHC19683.1 hypothetical protein LRS73_29650 [Methylobacterium currus]
MADVEMIIMVEDENHADIKEVAKSLEAKGLHVHKTIPRFRTIFGTSDIGLVNAFKDVAGVEAVRPQTNFQLPPMDEKVPQ